MPGVFVSHAYADRALAEAFVDTILKLGCGAQPEELFYSSGADTGVPSGANLNATVAARVADAGLVVALITPAFRSRPFCVAELGAAWSRTGSLFPLLAPGMGRDELGGVLDGLAVRHIDDPASLDHLHDRVSQVIGRRTRTTTWGDYKAKWLASIAPGSALSAALSAPAAPCGGGAAIAITSDRAGRMMLVRVAADGAGVEVRWHNQPGRWTSWERLAIPAAPRAVAATSAWPEHCEIFALGTDGSVWHRWFWREQGWHQDFEPLGHPFASEPATAIAATSDAEGHMDVQARTSGGRHRNIWFGSADQTDTASWQFRDADRRRWWDMPE